MVPQTPTPRNPRHLLPVWLGGIANNPPAWARERDFIQMHAEGLLDVLRPREAYADDYEYLTAHHAHTHLVDDLGMAGIYEAHVRRTGTVYTCPPWCDDDDHPRTGICDGTDNEPHHLATAEAVQTDAGAVQVAVSGTVDHQAINSDRAEDLTAAEARHLAALLLNAADTLDGIAKAARKAERA